MDSCLPSSIYFPYGTHLGRWLPFSCGITAHRRCQVGNSPKRSPQRHRHVSDGGCRIIFALGLSQLGWVGMHRSYLSKTLSFLHVLSCHALALMQLPALAEGYYLIPRTTFDILCKTTVSFALMLIFCRLDGPLRIRRQSSQRRDLYPSSNPHKNAYGQAR